MKNSKIEWTHHTFNPWWGCTKVSAACEHCYAETFAKRTGHDVWGPNKARRFFGEDHWAQPLKWNEEATETRERQRVFCSSMADVFEKYEGPDWQKFISAQERVFDIMEKTPSLDWLLLTKRPENILKSVPTRWRGGFPRNVWTGTTVENQEQAHKRIPKLLMVPAQIHFLSMEPLLGQVDLSSVGPGAGNGSGEFACNPLLGEYPYYRDHDGEPCVDYGKAIDWIICGGESGPKSRPMHPEWARSLRDQCQAANVAFFFKQWGEWLPEGQGFTDRYHEAKDGFYRVGKAKAGRFLDGKEWNEVPGLQVQV